jgi:hypothetical protein
VQFGGRLIFRRAFASAGFVLGLFLQPEDGSDMFLRNGILSPNYNVLQPRNSIFHTITAFACRNGGKIRMASIRIIIIGLCIQNRNALLIFFLYIKTH